MCIGQRFCVPCVRVCSSNGGSHSCATQAAGGWVHNGRLNGVLAVSRAFGDVEHKLLKEKCWEKSFVSDPLIVDPVLYLLVPCLPSSLSSLCSNYVSFQEIRRHELHTSDEFIILACDGLWGVMSSQQVRPVVPLPSCTCKFTPICTQAVNFVRKKLVQSKNVQVVASQLVEKALELASNDNVTALVVCLGNIAEL